MRSAICVQLASYLEGGPLMWMMPLHINQKSNYDDMMIISNKNYITMQFHCVVKKVHDLKDSGKKMIIIL